MQIHLVLIKVRGNADSGMRSVCPRRNSGGRAIGGPLGQTGSAASPDATDGVDLIFHGGLVPGLKIHHIPAQELQRVSIVIDADFATDAVGTGSVPISTRSAGMLRCSATNYSTISSMTRRWALEEAAPSSERAGAHGRSGPACRSYLAEIFPLATRATQGRRPVPPFHLDDLRLQACPQAPLALINSTKSFIAYLSCSVRENSSQLQRLSGKHVFSKRAAGVFLTRSLSTHQQMRSKRKEGRLPFSSQQHKKDKRPEPTRRGRPGR